MRPTRLMVRLAQERVFQFAIFGVLAFVVGLISGATVGSSMNPAVVAVFGTIGGATIGAIASSWLSEYYKRYRDTKATSYALAGELSSHIEAMSDQTLDLLQQVADLAKRGEFPGFSPFEASDLIYEKSIDKLGLFERDIPQRLVTVYGRIRACRGALQHVAKGQFSENQGDIANQFAYYIYQWKNHIRPDGFELIKDLNDIGSHTLWDCLRESITLQRQQR